MKIFPKDYYGKRNMMPDHVRLIETGLNSERASKRGYKIEAYRVRTARNMFGKILCGMKTVFRFLFTALTLLKLDQSRYKFFFWCFALWFDEVIYTVLSNVRILLLMIWNTRGKYFDTFTKRKSYIWKIIDRDLHGQTCS